RDPWLRASGCWKRDSKIIQVNRAPIWLIEPVRRKKRARSAKQKREQREIDSKAKRMPRWPREQINTQEPDENPLAPFIGAATKKTGEDWQESKKRFGKRTRRSPALADMFSSFVCVLHQVAGAGVVWDSL